MKHNVEELIGLFNDTFKEYNTQLVKGNNEPIYLPAFCTDIGIEAKKYAQIVFAHGFFSSALHEIAHWCLAGAERREQIDFGYWYCPDGRTAKQQQDFQKAEIKPQAIEWGFCLASNYRFNVSCDNLSGDEFGRQPNYQAFKQQVKQQLMTYSKEGFPKRAEQFMRVLAQHYQRPWPISEYEVESYESTKVN